MPEGLPLVVDIEMIYINIETQRRPPWQIVSSPAPPHWDS
jgi:hypothetical protein